MRRIASVAVCSQSRFIQATTNKRGGRSLCRPLRFRESSLLQAGHRRQVSRELRDASRAAPVGTEATRIDRREAAVESCRVIAGEGIAGAPRQVGVGSSSTTLRMSRRQSFHRA